jgi:hypothetical protein
VVPKLYYLDTIEEGVKREGELGACGQRGNKGGKGRNKKRKKKR